MLNLENPITRENLEQLEKHKSYGKVPQYLEKIKEEMKSTEERRQEERAKARMPPGTRLMTEDERISTLEELQRQKREISDMLFSIPLSCKTEALKNRKRELEAKLIEIERAVTTFSRKVVYIKEDHTEGIPEEVLPVCRPPTAPIKKRK